MSMDMIEVYENINQMKFGKEMYQLIEKLYPICRSITGNGVRETLEIIKEIIPMKIFEVPSGTQVFDWTIPNEWNIKDAYIENSSGEKIVDFKKSNLHILNYSIPVNKNISLEELKKHIFTLPENPDWIPYRTSYYEENWGFCLTHNQLEALEDDTYHVVIDSTLEKGSLTYGETFLKGEIDDEIILSCYVCHPSMCNDNLSGVALLTILAKILKNSTHRYSYRLLFVPETIGTITWLSKNEANLSKIKYGLVATCLGDKGNSTYKKCQKEDAMIDKIVEKVLKESRSPYEIIDFYPLGSDERQFCAPGFDLPIGSLMRTPYHKYPEYHNSADNLDCVTSNALEDTLKKYFKTMIIIENNKIYKNLFSKGEPQLGKRGLYSKIGARNEHSVEKIAMSWILNQSDGKKSLLDISNRSNIDFITIMKSAKKLLKENVLDE
jgi:aminopeptidase-like protein